MGFGSIVCEACPDVGESRRTSIYPLQLSSNVLRTSTSEQSIQLSVHWTLLFQPCDCTGGGSMSEGYKGREQDLDVRSAGNCNAHSSTCRPAGTPSSLASLSQSM